MAARRKRKQKAKSCPALKPKTRPDPREAFQNDLVQKSALYADAGIVEYWIVDVQGKYVHVFRQPSFGVYTDRSLAKPGQQVTPLAPCNAPLDLQELFGD